MELFKSFSSGRWQRSPTGLSPGTRAELPVLWGIPRCSGLPGTHPPPSAGSSAAALAAERSARRSRRPARGAPHRWQPGAAPAGSGGSGLRGKRGQRVAAAGAHLVSEVDLLFAVDLLAYAALLCQLLQGLHHGLRDAASARPGSAPPQPGPALLTALPSPCSRCRFPKASWALYGRFCSRRYRSRTAAAPPAGPAPVTAACRDRRGRPELPGAPALTARRGLAPFAHPALRVPAPLRSRLAPLTHFRRAARFPPMAARAGAHRDWRGNARRRYRPAPPERGSAQPGVRAGRGRAGTHRPRPALPPRGEKRRPLGPQLRTGPSPYGTSRYRPPLPG